MRGGMKEKNKMIEGNKSERMKVEREYERISKEEGKDCREEEWRESREGRDRIREAAKMHERQSVCKEEEKRRNKDE